MGVCRGDSKESFFETETSDAVFQCQVILNQKPIEIGIFPWDLALTWCVMTLTSLVKQFEAYWWKVLYKWYMLLKKSEEKNCKTEIIQRIYLCERKFYSPAFLVCYMHNVCFVLSLCHFLYLIWALARKWGIDG